MDGIEKITGRIAQDAGREIDGILADARRQAAEIAAYYSKAYGGQNIAVDYTFAKNVKKPPASKPGFVIYHTNWTAYVTPDAEEIRRMREK